MVCRAYRFVVPTTSMKWVKNATFFENRRSKTLNTITLNSNIKKMKSHQDWSHNVLQKLIIVFLGLLTIGVALQSCTSTNHATCSAYDKVEVPKQ
jgi:hypothetical protein